MEDTHVTLDDLRKEFSATIVDAIECLTHDKSIPYDEYLAKVRANPLATRVKIADLKHNMDLSRLPAVTPKDMERVQTKYKPALDFLGGNP